MIIDDSSSSSYIVESKSLIGISPRSIQTDKVGYNSQLDNYAFRLYNTFIEVKSDYVILGIIFKYTS